MSPLFVCILALLLAVSDVQATRIREHCVKKAVDTLFILDASGSVGPDSFEKEKQFAINVVNGLDIGPGRSDSRVALMIYSTGPHIVFSFDTDFDKDTIVQRIASTSWIGRSTATGAALDLARTALFSNSAGGYRGEDAAVIVITDGHTLEDYAVFQPAVDALKATGVSIYAFGVGHNGDVNVPELEYIATALSNVFLLDEFDQLASLSFAQTTIEAISCTWCTYKDVDLAFILDASGSVNNKFDQIKQFAADFVSYLIVGKDDSRVAAIRFSTGPRLFLNFNDTFVGTDVANAILNIPRVGASTATGAALDMFTEVLTNPASGRRDDAELVAILITDGQTLEDYSEFLPAVDRFHATGVNAFAFGIGRRINTNELSLIASPPAASHVYLVDSISILDLQRFVHETVLNVMCDGTGATTVAATTQAATTQAPRSTPAGTTPAGTTQAVTTDAATTDDATTAAPRTTLARTTPARTTPAGTTADATTEEGTTQPASTRGPSTTQLPCRRRTLDLVLVLDSSAGVGNGWASVIDFVKSIVDDSNIGRDSTHIATIVYSSTAALLFEFTSTYDLSQTLTNLDVIPLSPVDQSNPAAALDLAASLFTTPGSGYRGGAAAVLVVAGSSFDVPTATLVQSAQSLQSLGVDVFAVSVGSATTNEVEAIASETYDTHAASAASYNDLAALAPSFSHYIFCYAGSDVVSTTPMATATPTPRITFTQPVDTSATPAITTVRASTSEQATTESATTKQATTQDATTTAAQSTTADATTAAETTGAASTTEAASSTGAASTTQVLGTTGAATTAAGTTRAQTTAAPTTVTFHIVNCTDGYTQDGDSCACSDSFCRVCQITQAGSACLACASNMILFNGQCVGECPSGYLRIMTSSGLVCEALCHFRNIDIAFLIDSSSSISTDTYTSILQFATQVLSYLPVDSEQDTVRLALLNFAEGTEVELLFRDQHGLAVSDLQDIVRHSAYQGGSTDIANALHTTFKLFSSDGTGYRGGNGAVVLFSDGQACSEAVLAAGVLKSHGIDVAAVGFGTEIDVAELKAIASTDAHVFVIASDSATDMLAMQLAERLSCTDQPPVFDGPQLCDEGVFVGSGQPCDCGQHCTVCRIASNGDRFCTGVAGCEFAPVDVVFLLDASDDIGEDQFPFAVEFLQNMIMALPVGANDVHVAVMTYSDDSLLDFNFKSSFSAHTLASQASGLQFIGGPANLAAALDDVRTKLLWSSANGYRGNAFSVVIIGDGPVGAEAIQAAHNLKVEDVIIFGVGVGGGNLTALSVLVESPQDLYIPNSLELLRDSGFAEIVAGSLVCAQNPAVTSSPLYDGTTVSSGDLGSGAFPDTTVSPSYTQAPNNQAPVIQGQSQETLQASPGGSGSGMPTTVVAVIASVGGVALVAAIALFAVKRSQSSGSAAIAAPNTPPRLNKKKHSDLSFDLTWENEFMANAGLSSVESDASLADVEATQSVVRRHAPGTIAEEH